MARDLIEWVTDQLLVLYTCNEAKKVTNLHKTRLQKIVFMSEYNLWEASQEGFNYQFIKFKHGPFSDELKSDVKRLQKVKLLHLDDHGYHLRPEGYSLIDDFRDILSRNEVVINSISNISEVVMEADFEQLLTSIYDAPNPLNTKLTIRDTPSRKYLLTREMKQLIRKNNKSSELNPFNITESEAEDLEVLFDPGLKKKMLESDESVRRGNLKLWTPLTS